MNLEIINTKKMTTPGFYSEVMAISVMKSNIFRFSKPAFENFKLKENKDLKADFIKDKDNPNQFYLRISTDGIYTIRNRNIKEYSFTNKKLKEILRQAYSCKKDDVFVFEIKEAISTTLGNIHPLVKVDAETLVNYKKN